MNGDPDLTAPPDPGSRDPIGNAGATAPDSGDWRRHAACAGEDPELFFPVGSSGPALTQIAAAKAVCARCPVAEACLRHAVTTGLAYGIWGGLTEEERRGLRYRGQSSAEGAQVRQLPPTGDSLDDGDGTATRPRRLRA